MQEQAIDAATLRRWRLILGPEAAQPLAAAQPLDDADARRDAALDYLYQREHRLREQPDGAGTDAWQGTGGLSARQGGSGVPEPQAVHWLGEVRDLFPRSAVETLQRDALSRYGLHGLLGDPQVLAQATPSIELVAALMAVRASLPVQVLDEARRLVARVVADLQARLSSRVHSALGRRRRRRSGRGQGQMSDLDWPRALRHNLRHYQRPLYKALADQLAAALARHQGQELKRSALGQMRAALLDAMPRPVRKVWDRLTQ